jgi:opacity protein-like surface antigen
MFGKSSFVVLAALVGLLSLVPAASAAQPVVVVGGGFYRFYAPGWGPAWYGPGWAPYPVVSYTGEVKIKTNYKNAAVFIDGGYAGQTAKLKKFALRPGAYDIELRDPSGHAFYQERIQVIPGRTLQIHADSRG